jgi:hypothetical protein
MAMKAPDAGVEGTERGDSARLVIHGAPGT